MSSRAELYQARLTGFQRVIARQPDIESTASPSSSQPPAEQNIDVGDRVWWPIDVDLGDPDNPVDVDFWDYLSAPPPSPPRTVSGRIRLDKKVFQCGICWDTLLKPSMPLCMHIFCHGCLITWIKKGHQTCPVCRAVIRSTPIRDDAFELELYGAISDGEVSRPSFRSNDVTPYTWPGVVFED